MVELTNRERLQPSLLDRLTDHYPNKNQESREERVLSLSQVRQAVERDLAWLLNCGSLESVEDLDGYPEVIKSVVNFGIRDLAGATVSGTDIGSLERHLRDVILHFEPRILANSLRVTVKADAETMHRNAMVFQIEGKLWAQPLPLRLFWNTEVDFETGDFHVTEARG